MSVSVFLDGANFFFMQRDGLGWFVDTRKLLSYIGTNFGDISDAFYYIGQDSPPPARQKGYLDALAQMGYSVVTKPIKSIYDTKTGAIKRKANLDIEIVLDMFNTIDRYDRAVLISGDGDFERALQQLRARGKAFHVFSTMNFVARELRAVSGMHYTDIATLRTQLEKTP